jgi:hypothetical protein
MFHAFLYVPCTRTVTARFELLAAGRGETLAFLVDAAFRFSFLKRRNLFINRSLMKKLATNQQQRSRVLLLKHVKRNY